jgi:hypothetical protein
VHVSFVAWWGETPPLSWSVPAARRPDVAILEPNLDVRFHRSMRRLTLTEAISHLTTGATGRQSIAWTTVAKRLGPQSSGRDTVRRSQLGQVRGTQTAQRSEYLIDQYEVMSTVVPAAMRVRPIHSEEFQLQVRPGILGRHATQVSTTNRLTRPRDHSTLLKREAAPSSDRAALQYPPSAQGWSAAMRVCSSVKISSTRRFDWRPSTLSLEAMGKFSPLPIVVI